MNLRRAGIAAVGALVLGGGTLALLPGAAGAKAVGKAPKGQPGNASDEIEATGLLIQSRSTNRFTFVASGSSSHPCSLSSADDQPVIMSPTTSVRCTLIATGTIDPTSGDVTGTIRVSSTDGTINLPFFNHTGCGTERQRGGATQTIFGEGDVIGDPTPTTAGAISTVSVDISIFDVTNGPCIAG